MGSDTKIEWCDHTFSPWREQNGTRVVAADSAWRQVEKWDRDAKAWREQHLVPTSVFCGSMWDVFEDWQGLVRDSRGRPLHNAKSWNFQGEWIGIEDTYVGRSLITLADVRARLVRLIDATRLTWLLLTKRPENIRRMTPIIGTDIVPPHEMQGPFASDIAAKSRRPNLWLGTSIACQEDADRNIPELLKCRDLCAGLFLSIEPLVGPVDLSAGDWICQTCDAYLSASRVTYVEECDTCGSDVEWHNMLHGIDQVIVGGESGPNARPCNIAWIRSIVLQCADAGVPCFVKQVGAEPYMDGSGSERFRWPAGFEVVGDRTKLLTVDRKGGDPSEWPEDLRVRQLAWRAS